MGLFANFALLNGIHMKNKLLLALMVFFGVTMAEAQPVIITPPSATIEPGGSVTLTASGAMFYMWSPEYGLSETEGPVTVASPMVTTTYTCSGYAPGDESVVNGDFSQGNMGFTSDYQYNTNLWNEGTYYVDYDASLHHENFFGNGHGDNGNFMIVNGATVPRTNVWTEQITVRPNTYYAFTTWVCTLAGQANEVALLQFSINGNQIGEVFSAPPERYVWERFYELWYSGDATSATITILNQNTVGSGNDFGLDDISFCEIVLVGAPECTVTVGTMTASAYAESPELCEGGSTQLYVEATGGTQNYTYSWTPADLLDDPASQHPTATPPVGNTVFTCHVTGGSTSQEVSVDVSVYPNVEKHVDMSICEGDTYEFYGEILDAPGVYTHHLFTQHNCDSLLILTLTIDEYQVPPVVNQYECYAYGTTPAWTWDKTGITYHEDTYDEIILDDPEGGCPIKHRLELRFHEEYYHEESKVACDSFCWPVNGVTYYESQDRVEKTFHHQFGDKQCDSTYVLHLVIGDYQTNEYTVPYDESCDSYFWDDGGLEYTTVDTYDPANHVYEWSGTYHRTYYNDLGCDSVVTMHMNFDYTPNPSDISPADENNLYPHWVVTATEFQINSYDFMFWDHNEACRWDSVRWEFEDPNVLWLLEPDSTTNPSGKKCRMYVLNYVEDTVWLSATAYNRCAPEGVERRYWFVCSFYGIDEREQAAFSVLPNPNKGQMTLRFDHLIGQVDIKVYDMTGKQIDHIQTQGDGISNVMQYDMEGRPDGIYLFVATSKNATITKKVIVNK